MEDSIFVEFYKKLDETKSEMLESRKKLMESEKWNEKYQHTISELNSEVRKINKNEKSINNFNNCAFFSGFKANCPQKILKPVNKFKMNAFF